MAKNLFKAKFENKLPLGGIATGHIDFGCDGSISAKTPSFFAVKAEKDGILADARLLQSTRIDGVPLSCLENSRASAYFPFTETAFSGSSFPAEIMMKAFSPFIPLNDTDSGIPAAVFEIEITNNCAERTDYSVCLVSSNVNENAFNRMGCTDTGEAYVFLTGAEENSENTCIATNAKNVSFCEYTDMASLIKNFTQNETLFNKTKMEFPDSFAYGALCTHFSLNAGETKKAVFCLSWYNPDNKYSRNYYAQYFESSLECASYIFRQHDRLYSSAMEFSENVFAATIGENVLEEVNRDLFGVLSRPIYRLDNGLTVSDKSESFTDINSFINRADVLTNLFPSLERSQTEHFYRSGIYEDARDGDKLFSVIKCYRNYILSADTDGLIENWYYIAKCMESVFGEDGKASCKENSALQSAAIEAAHIMADAVKDKKRAELYSSMLNRLPLSQVSMDLSEGFARLNEISGFEYNAVNKHIGFSPESDFCPLDTGNTFRCLFCTPSCYGYVEEGIDYIEINILHGSLILKSFSVPRTPRLVQYGGRNWRFENKNLTCILDSDLEVTPNKKLTIFIDIKQ